MPRGIAKNPEVKSKKISVARLGKRNLPVGFKHSEMTKQKLREYNLKVGKIPPSRKGIKLTEDHKAKVIQNLRRDAMVGKKHSIETRKQMSISHPKEKCNFWKGGITEENQKIRHSLEYKLWREAVFKRDNWVCRFCGKRGGELNADHIKRFADYPELRFAIDNGRTLCISCHRKTYSYKHRE